MVPQSLPRYSQRTKPASKEPILLIRPHSRMMRIQLVRDTLSLCPLCLTVLTGVVDPLETGVPWNNAPFEHHNHTTQSPPVTNPMWGETPLSPSPTDFYRRRITMSICSSLRPQDFIISLDEARGYFNGLQFVTSEQLVVHHDPDEAMALRDPLLAHPSSHSQGADPNPIS
ncbi:hypothetical protein BS47DRAFT_892389 [Hydnum rufescens UP504]|uniref:Uncharacterized protein n=1 Tax=Hydnum rufescens UP504 TaxID=1448309 RepID=A0A9P6AYA6_9AGAM|nr:hypothetical protein BS47DRAFT_892389 [Hydnum rufescens UP504]